MAEYDNNALDEDPGCDMGSFSRAFERTAEYIHDSAVLIAQVGPCPIDCMIALQSCRTAEACFLPKARRVQGVCPECDYYAFGIM